MFLMWCDNAAMVWPTRLRLRTGVRFQQSFLVDHQHMPGQCAGHGGLDDLDQAALKQLVEMLQVRAALGRGADIDFGDHGTAARMVGRNETCFHDGSSQN